MATELWLLFPVLVVMMASGLLAVHPRFRNSRRVKVINLVIAVVCFAAVVALLISFLAGS
jgi:hypothetical protein